MNNSMSMKEDILKEIMNIYIGQAASLLSEVIDKKVELSIPNVEIFNDKDFALANGKIPKFSNGLLMISRISFENELNGRADLIFPAEHIKKLVSLCTGEDQLYEGVQEFTDIDFDVMKELGNIILNSVVGGISNLLDMKVDYTLPEVKIFDTIEIEKELNEDKDAYILLLFVTFKIEGTKIDGALIISFTVESMYDLMGKIQEIEKEL